MPLAKPACSLFLVLAVLMSPLASQLASAAELDLSGYRGKVVVVDFWASWCAPCRRSFPWLNDLQKRYGTQGLVVLGVNTDVERSDAETFLKEVPAHFPILFDPHGDLASHYRLPGMPTSLVFGPDGTLLRTHVGFRDAQRAERESEVVRLLEGIRTL